MNLRNVKISKLLIVGIATIIAVMISATFYSTYLSSRAQNIIRNSTTRIFDVLAIQRDIEDLFSALSNLVVVEEQEELNFASENIRRLFDRAENTVHEGREKQVFNENDYIRTDKIY